MMKKNVFLMIAFLSLFACTAQRESTVLTQKANASNNGKATFDLDLSMDNCSETLLLETRFVERVDSSKNVRIIKANGIPNHQVGVFPNQGNPNKISEQSNVYAISLNPTMNKKKTPGEGIRVGILFSGVELDPFSNEFFQGRNGPNRDWNITPLTTSVDLGLDCNNAHVQPGGKYHYHGTPTGMIEHAHADTLEMIKLGYAADGYPIYYKYGYDSEGEIVEMTSGYQLKDGDRPGDGVNAPKGAYDGMYFQDYEYVVMSSLLDECNGRWGKTPEKENEYYYVITDNFPSSPICFSAKPSNDFRNGPPSTGPGRQGTPNMNNQRGGPGGRPSPDELIQQMDTNKDERLSRKEVRGPLINDFDRVDINGDGFITLEELSKGAPRR